MKKLTRLFVLTSTVLATLSASAETQVVQGITGRENIINYIAELQDNFNERHTTIPDPCAGPYTAGTLMSYELGTQLFIRNSVGGSAKQVILKNANTTIIFTLNANQDDIAIISSYKVTDQNEQINIVCKVGQND